jgi:spermidine synthase
MYPLQHERRLSFLLFVLSHLSQRFLPEWSDCGNLVGRSDNCFDDARVKLYFEDAFKWFEDHFLAADKASEDPFDVIIMDAL